VRLPDPARSRALLIGTGDYRSEAIPNLPAVGNNLTDLVAVLTDPELGGLKAERCVTLKDPMLRDAYRILKNTVLDCEDTLIIYFAGHGFTGDRNELFLGVTDTDLEELDVSALRAVVLRDLLLQSPAAAKVVILDCCFAARAFANHMAADADVILGQVDVQGTYTLASARANDLAAAAPGARYTAFTGELLALLRFGVPDGAELLTFSSLFPLLYLALSRQGLPLPDQCNTGTISQLALSRNPAFHPPVVSPPPDVVFGGADAMRPVAVRHHPADRDASRRESASAEEQRAVTPPPSSAASAMSSTPKRVESLTYSKILGAVKNEAVTRRDIMSRGRMVAPNHYVVHVSPRDFQQLEPRAGVLARALAKSLTNFLRERGYSTNYKIFVEIEPGDQAISGCQVTATKSPRPSAADSRTARSRRFVPGSVSQVQRIRLRLGGHPGGLYATEAKSDVQPVDILAAMQHEASALKKVLAGDRILVPNRYMVRLSRGDHTRLAIYASVIAQELAQSQAEFIGEQVWTVYGDVIVEIERESSLDAGMFRVTAEVYTGGPV
jgi:Protein of unknown function (DUF3662)/Caspase domain